jgi:hypothetical protein
MTGWTACTADHSIHPTASRQHNHVGTCRRKSHVTILNLLTFGEQLYRFSWKLTDLFSFMRALEELTIGRHIQNHASIRFLSHSRTHYAY